MVLRENDRTFVTEFFAQTRFEPDFFLHPNRHRSPKRDQAAWRGREIRREQPFEFQKRFFVERDEIELGGAGETGFAQAVVDRMPGESGVVLSPRESLFLRSRHDLAVAHETGSAVVIKRRNAENVHGCWARNLTSSSAAIW